MGVAAGTGVIETEETGTDTETDTVTEIETDMEIETDTGIDIVMDVVTDIIEHTSKVLPSKLLPTNTQCRAFDCHLL